MNRPPIVLKFGSSVLRTALDLPKAVHEIYRYAREGYGVIAVVSAFQGVTDRLFAQATSLGADPAHDIGIMGLAVTVVQGGLLGRLISRYGEVKVLTGGVLVNAAGFFLITSIPAVTSPRIM